MAGFFFLSLAGAGVVAAGCTSVININENNILQILNILLLNRQNIYLMLAFESQINKGFLVEQTIFFGYFFVLL